MKIAAMNRKQVIRHLVIAVLTTCCAQRMPGAPSEEDSYLSCLQKSIASVGSNLPAITKSAEQAAGDFLSGGNLWAAGRQADFISEACGRAGGLMSIAPLGKQSLTNRDVILYAVPGRLDVGDANLIEQWQKKGARVVRFDSRAGVFGNGFPVDTVINVCELWTWTGEFVAACARLGKMPVLYQSYGLPGGPERGRKYQGKKDHDDFTIQPIAPGVLGQAYLDQVRTMLAEIQRTQMPKIVQAAKWWREASSNSTTILVTGHMFPRHALDPRTIPCGRFVAAPAWEDKELLDPATLPKFLLHLGYQFAAQKLVDQARASGMKLVYSTVQAAKPPEPASNILYLEPGWPLTDACVRVPGYDVPILPASGVIQAAIYWSIMAERAKAIR